MKTYIAISLAALLLSAASVSVHGTDLPNAPEISEAQKEETKQRLQAAIDALDLSEDQKAEFKAISKKYAKEMMAVRDSDAGKFKKAKKLKSINKAKNKEMEQLLSEEQYEAYLDFQKEAKKKMKEKMKEKKS